MSEEMLRNFFADVSLILNIKLGCFCDRNSIFRSDFSNFMKGKKYYCSLHDLNIMALDILYHINSFSQMYKKIV